MLKRLIVRRTLYVVALMNAYFAPVQAARSAEPNPQSVSERRSLGAIFDDTHLHGSVLDVHARAATMLPETRYEFLSVWVLPTDDHATLRMALDFAPTQVAPPVSDRDSVDVERGRAGVGPSRIAIGGNLVSPALDLVHVAQELGRLEELRKRVEQAPATSGPALRSRASMLALVDIARGDFATANRNLDLLERLLQVADHSEFNDHWPETLVILEGIRYPQIREVARDLVSYILLQLRQEKANGPDAWERFVGTLAGRLKQLDQSQSPQAPRLSFHAPPPLKNWLPVSRSTARTRGNGFPRTHWHVSPGKVEHYSGHSADYLFFRIPLRGNFAIECDLGGFGWRDTQLMVGGTWVASLVDHVSYGVGSFRGERPSVLLEPRLPQTGEWIRCRIVVADGAATTFFNGRRIHVEPLPPKHDPWIAIRSPYYGFGGARDVRITGTPKIPDQVRISALADLNGWLS